MGAQSRVRVFLEGIVQGVGMRPHVARIAQRFGLTGLVGNNERGVFIEFQGDATALHNAQKTLIDELPPLAHLSLIHISEPTRQCCTSRMPSSA